MFISFAFSITFLQPPLHQPLNMTCLRIDAEALAIRLHSLNTVTGASSRTASLSALPIPQDADPNLETLHALFATTDTCDYDEERPQKRYKIDPSSATSKNPAYLQDNQSVVLAKVSINLVGLDVKSSGMVN